MSEYKYLGNQSAVEPEHTRFMSCEDCMVAWHGCWDNFQCPKCEQGELPNRDYSAIDLFDPLPETINVNQPEKI